MSADINVARNYGNKVVRIELEEDLEKAHVGLINKDGNYNKNVGNGIKIVLNGQAAINELYEKLYDAEIIH